MKKLPRWFFKIRKDQTNCSNIANQYYKDIKKIVAAVTKLAIDVIHPAREVVLFAQSKYKPRPLTQSVENQLDNILDAIPDAGVKEMVGRFIKTAYTRGSQQAEKLLEAVKQPPGKQPVDLKFPTSVAENLINVNVSLIKSVAQQHLSKIRVLVAETLASQKTMDELIKDIMKLAKVSYRRARFIAYNEVRRAINNAHARTYLAGGVTKWAWRASFEPGMCQFCEGLHGKVVKIGQSFGKSPHTGREVYKPPDPHPNCKCGIVPVPSGFVVPSNIPQVPTIKSVT